LSVFLFLSLRIQINEMSFPEVVDLCSDDEVVHEEVNVVTQEPGSNSSTVHQKKNLTTDWAKKPRSMSHRTWEESPANRSANILNSVESNSAIQGQLGSATNGSALPSRLPPAPLCRQFWKAGNYDDAQAAKLQLQGGQNHLRVHPKFLHSNATSHKWAFGGRQNYLTSSLSSYYYLVNLH
ncbi:Microrchidia-like protein, partial [Thalictrum thalictroides]